MPTYDFWLLNCDFDLLLKCMWTYCLNAFWLIAKTQFDLTLKYIWPLFNIMGPRWAQGGHHYDPFLKLFNKGGNLPSQEAVWNLQKVLTYTWGIGVKSGLLGFYITALLLSPCGAKVCGSGSCPSWLTCIRSPRRVLRTSALFQNVQWRPIIRPLMI